MKQINENIIHLYNKWKEGYVRKENDIKNRIKNFLNGRDDIKDFVISEDGKSVSYIGDEYLYIHDYDLINGEIPIPFDTVSGTFMLDCKELKSLKNAPKHITGGVHIMDAHKLKSLDGYIERVDGEIMIMKCGLTSLKNFPSANKACYFMDCNNISSIEGLPDNCECISFYKCNGLTSLVGAPDEPTHFYVKDCNNVSSLEGAPRNVKGNFGISECDKIESLDGAPDEVGGIFDCSKNKNLKSIKTNITSVDIFECDDCPNLTSLEGLPKIINSIRVDKRFTKEDVRSNSDIKKDIIYGKNQ